MVQPTNQDPPDPTRLHPPNPNIFRKTKIGAKPSQCRTRTKPKTRTPIPTPYAIIRQLIIQKIISIGSVLFGVDWLARLDSGFVFGALSEHAPQILLLVSATSYTSNHTSGFRDVYSPAMLMASSVTHSFQIINNMHLSAASHDHDQVELRMRQMSYRTSGRSRKPLARPPRPARHDG